MMKALWVSILGGIIGAMFFHAGLAAIPAIAENDGKVVSANVFVLEDTNGQVKGYWSVGGNGNPSFFLVNDYNDVNAGYAALTIDNTEGTLTLSNAMDQTLILGASQQLAWRKVMKDWISSR